MQFVARYNIYTVFKSEIKTTVVCINLSKFTVAQKGVYMYKFLGNWSQSIIIDIPKSLPENQTHVQAHVRTLSLIF